MNLKSRRILAIETSCDETAASVIEVDMNSMRITPLSNVVYSQIDLHKKYGGVYPELASREHIKKIRPVVEQALAEALASAQVESRKYKVESMNSNLLPSTFNLLPTAIDAIAVTTGPGLAGSLIVGVEFARGLAASLNLPVIPVNHLEGHIYACGASVSNGLSLRAPDGAKQSHQIATSAITPPRNDTLFPALALIVSGGHTMLVLMRKHLDYKIIGTTLDDAAGECFDKVARMLGLPYPGGPALSKLAEKGDAKAYDFPRAMINSGDYNFSFSGLKTAVFYKLRELRLVNEKAEPISPARVASGKCKVASKNAHLSPVTCSPVTKADVAASAQAAIVDVLVQKTLRAAADYKVKSILVGGGVSANSALRAAFTAPSVIARIEKTKQSQSDCHAPQGLAMTNISRAGCEMFLSPTQLATDNALSIAIAAAYHLMNGDATSWRDLDTNASLRLQ